MHVAVVLIERQRQRRLLDYSTHGGLGVRTPAIDEGLSEHAGLPGVRVRITAIKIDRALEHPQRLLVVRPGSTVVEQFSRKHALIGREVFWRLTLHAVVRRGCDAARKDRGDR